MKKLEREIFLSNFYTKYYSKIYNTSGIAKIGFSFTHKVLESTFKGPVSQDTSILEIGAGKAEHFPFVTHSFSKYVLLDLFEEPEIHPAKDDQRAQWVQADICNVQLTPNSFDRIISMCVLHHLEDPMEALENIAAALKPGGTFSLFLPSDPGLLTRLNRSLTVKRSSRKLGFYDYDLMAAFEHKNHYWGLRTMLTSVFTGWETTKKFFPINISSGNLSLFSIHHFTKPEYDHRE